jgi:hypothetical protein
MPFNRKNQQRQYGDVTNRKKLRLAVVALALVLLVSLAGNAYLFFLFKKSRAQTPKVQAQSLGINADQSFGDIERYLTSISPSYVADVQSMAAKNGLPSWGCGPASYSLAKIIDQKFFSNKLSVVAAYDAKDPDEIVQRFSFHQSGDSVEDHAWLEIYLGNKFLFVDPTIGQFGKTTGIAYQVFNVNDANIASELQSQYGISDMRLSLLVQKAVNRVPTSQEPYPGYALDPGTLNYYLQAYDDRNDVNNGKQPADWDSWVSYLVPKYTS